jgi:murein tripeptide amidase MpaA
MTDFFFDQREKKRHAKRVVWVVFVHLSRDSAPAAKLRLDRSLFQRLLKATEALHLK